MGRQTPPKPNATKSQKQAKSPKLKIRQTPNAFFLFRTDLVAEIKRKKVDIPRQSDVSRLAGFLWAEDIPHDEKSYYEDEAAALREQARQEAIWEEHSMRKQRDHLGSEYGSDDGRDESELSTDDEPSPAPPARAIKRRRVTSQVKSSPPPPTSSRKPKRKRRTHHASFLISTPSPTHPSYSGEPPPASTTTTEASSSTPKKSPVTRSFIPTVVNFLANLRDQGANDAADANPSHENNDNFASRHAQSTPSSPAYILDEVPLSSEDASSNFPYSAWDQIPRTHYNQWGAFNEATANGSSLDEGYNSVAHQHPLPDLGVASHDDVPAASPASASPLAPPQYEASGRAPPGEGPTSCLPFSQCIPSTHAHVNDSGAAHAIEETGIVLNDTIWEQGNDWYQESPAADPCCSGTDYGVAADNNFDLQELSWLRSQGPSTMPVECSHASDDLHSMGVSPLLEEHAQAPVGGGAAVADSSSLLDPFSLPESANFSQAVQEWRLASS